MDAARLGAQAERLLRLHDRSGILALPNAWDAASARIFEDAGFPAIGTTSAGIAFALGYPDQERISRAEMADAVGRIVRAVRVPVTADMEAGYGDVEGTVAAVLESGAVGMNLEDAAHGAASPLVELSVGVDRIRRARRAADARGVPLVLNARTDVMLLELGPAETRLETAILRANAYRAAGADCLFIPGVREAGQIERLVRELTGPLNILAGAGVPPLPELRRLGIARLSLGSGPMRAALGLARRIAQELQGPGTYTALTGGALPYADLNRLLSPREG